MPTIDQLPTATLSSSTDAFMCSQGGIDRQVTLAQMLAPTQPMIALQQGQLVGRFGPGTGGAQTITVGQNLSLSNGVLSAPEPFNPATLPPGQTPGPVDIVAVSQAGTTKALNFSQFMSGIGGLSGIDGSNLLVTASGATSARTLAELADNSVSAEDFGAKGDGVSDDTAALSAAIASGQPVRLGPNTYCTTGQWTITGKTVTLQGVPGITSLRRLAQSSGGAWISIQSTSFRADGITFDSNSSITADTWAVLVAPSCLDSDFHQCNFIDAQGATMGCGLVFAAAFPATTQHTVRRCEASGNVQHGIWVQALQSVLLEGCRAFDNGTYGLCIDYADPALVQKLQYCQVVNNCCWNNKRGISVGNYNATNTTPPVWGNENPDALSILVANNVCFGNSSYGIAASGQALHIIANQLANNGLGVVGTGAGILANVSYSRIDGNVITGSAQYGIDAGGSIYTEIQANTVIGPEVGLNCGGGLNVRANANMLQGCTGWSVLVNNIETDGNGNNFGLACSGVDITQNWIGLTTTDSGGVYLADNPQDVRICDNNFVGMNNAAPIQSLLPCCSSYALSGNRWNYTSIMQISPSIIGTEMEIQFPDVIDEVVLSGTSGTIQTIQSMQQSAKVGEITFVAVTNGGSGYTNASVSIVGDGTGVTANAFVSDGSVIGITVTNPGSNYTTANVTVSGNGSGATASAVIGLPVIDNRRITVHCNEAVVFGAGGVNSTLQNWTGANFTAPQGTVITFRGLGGAWQATGIALADYVAPDGNGGVAITTTNGGDLRLHPSGSGALRHVSDIEQVGITSTIGRGSPTNIIAAPPGSDYRNLNGGAGQTYWVKQTGTNSTGWLAIA